MFYSIVSYEILLHAIYILQVFNHIRHCFNMQMQVWCRDLKIKFISACLWFICVLYVFTGECFMEHSSDLHAAYATYCRNHDDAIALLEKVYIYVDDTETLNILKDSFENSLYWYWIFIVRVLFLFDCNECSYLSVNSYWTVVNVSIWLC